MKRTIYIIFMTFILSAIQGCERHSALVDYECVTIYQIENQTDMAVTLRLFYSNGVPYRHPYGKTSIAPGEKKEIFLYATMCGKNAIITEESDLGKRVFTYLLKEAYADDRQIKEDLFNEENWTFSATEYYRATYLLVITDALIESVGYVE